MRVASDVLKATARIFDANSPKCAFTTDPTKVSSIAPSLVQDTDEADGQPKKRHRRIDQDLKLAVVSTMLSGGRASNPSACLRTIDVCSEKKALRWVLGYMQKYQAQGWNQCREILVRGIACCVDAKRLGQPAEETETYACVLYPHMKCMWLPVAVIWQKINEVKWVPNF